MTNLPDPMQNLPETVEGNANDMARQAEHLPQQAAEAVDQIPDRIEAVKDRVTEPIPTPPDMSEFQAPAEELLKRLNWGEPALTIIDVRSREAFNRERIRGAVPMPSDQIPQGVESTLEYKRDIYVYGASQSEAASAVNQLRQVGYTNVALVEGGLSAWKAIGGATEGTEAFASPARVG